MEKQNFTTKLYEVCSNDELRPIFMCVHFKDGFAYASDAHMIVKQSLEYHSIVNPELLDGKSIHKDNYKAIMQFEIATCDASGVQCMDNDGRTAFFEYFDRKGIEVPNFDTVLKPVGQKSIEFIGINPDYLHKLSKAMHSTSGALRLQFQGVDRAILVDAVGIDNQCGVIMPAILNDVLFK
jgi:hypothetical protein